MAEAAIETSERDGRCCAALSGDWTLATLPRPVAGIESRLHELAGRDVDWDLGAVLRIDSVGAIVLLRAWGRKWPASLKV